MYTANNKLVKTLETMCKAAMLLTRVDKGDVEAARALSAMARHIPYEGNVLCFPLDELIGDLLDAVEE